MSDSPIASQSVSSPAVVSRFERSRRHRRSALLVWNLHDERSDEPLERERKPGHAIDVDGVGQRRKRPRQPLSAAPLRVAISVRIGERPYNLETRAGTKEAKKYAVSRSPTIAAPSPFGADSVARVSPSGLRASRRAPVLRPRPRRRRASPESSRQPPPRPRRRDTPSQPHRPVVRPRRSHRCRRSARCRTDL